MNSDLSIKTNTNNYILTNSSKPVSEKKVDTLPDNRTPAQYPEYYGRDLLMNKPQKKEVKDINEVFKALDGKKGKDFADTAYKELVKYFDLSDVAPKELSWEDSEGRPIVSDYRWYENKVVLYKDYFKKAKPEEQIGYIAHELTHLKQTTNILRTENLPVQTYAVAIATSDFKANVMRNPQMQKAFQKALSEGTQDRFAKYMIQMGASQTYKELNTVFADVLKMPKHSLSSPEGQKALKDVQAQATYNGADEKAYNNCELEKEAMSVENDVVKKYKEFNK
jgi:hypothetical protein